MCCFSFLEICVLIIALAIAIVLNFRFFNDENSSPIFEDFVCFDLVAILALKMSANAGI